MTDIYFKCNCGKSLAVNIRGVGLKITCIDCNRAVVVPDADFDFVCPHCQTIHMAPAEITGNYVTCTACKRRTLVFNAHNELGRLDLRQRYPDFCIQRPTLSAPARDWRNSMRRPVLVATSTVAAVISVLVARHASINGQMRPPEIPISFDQTETPPVIVKHAQITDKTSAPSVPAMNAKESDSCYVHPAFCSELFFFTLRPASERRTLLARMAADSSSSAITPPALPPPVAMEHPARPLADRCAQLRDLFQKAHANGHNPELAEQLRKLREDFLDYTRTHCGGDLDAQYWTPTAQSLLWLCTAGEFTDFESADLSFRASIETIANARTDDPALNRRIMFDTILMHQQEWRYRAPVEVCAAWLDQAHAMVHESGDLRLRKHWEVTAANYELALIFESSARFSQTLEQWAAFRAAREPKLTAYLRDETVPLQYRTSGLWWWAAHLASAGAAPAAIRLLDDWRTIYADRISLPNFFELRMFLAFHHEGNVQTARDMVAHVAQLVKQNQIPADNWSWQNMTEKYYNYLLVPAYEVKRRHNREMKPHQQATWKLEDKTCRIPIEKTSG